MTPLPGQFVGPAFASGGISTLSRQQLNVTYETVTPIYTGNAEQEMDRLRETGLLGSLRWWFEALIRGMGGIANDPTDSSRRSLFDAKDYKKAVAKTTDERERLRQAGLDDAAQVFGATGWRRRFRLEVANSNLSPDQTHPTRLKLPNHSYIDHRNKNRVPTWYLDDAPLTGQFTLRVQSLHPDFDVELIAGLLYFLEEWAAIGAKNQLGLGIIRRVNGDKTMTTGLYNWLDGLPGNPREKRLPSLHNMFLARLKTDSENVRETFTLKYELRQQFRRKNDRNLRHFVMGSTRGRRRAAKIQMSLPYSEQEMRLWGWIPHRARVYGQEWDRERVVGRIHDHVQGNYTLLAWREFKSKRDTETADEDDISRFLRSLLAGGMEKE